MELSFNLNVEDWVAFQQYYQSKRSPLYKYVYPLLIILVAGLVILNILYFVYFKEEGSTVTWVSLIVLFFLAYVLYIRKKSLDRVRKAGLELLEKHPEAFGPMTMDFEKDMILIRSQQTSKSLKSDEMSKFEENKSYFFIYSVKGMVYILPKRDMNDISAVREILINYFSKE